MSLSAGSSPRSQARGGRATQGQGQTRGRSPLSASPSHLNLQPRPLEAPRDSSPLHQLIAAPSTSSSALSPRSRPLQSLPSALNAPHFSASAAGGSGGGGGSGSGGGGGGSERASAAYTDFIVRPDEPTCSVLERPAAPHHDAALSHELRALSADVRSGQARQEARHQEVMGALRHIAGGMMSARAAPPQPQPAPPPPSSSLRSHLGIGAPPARGTALHAPRSVSPQVAITPPTPYKPAVRGISSYAGPSLSAPAPFSASSSAVAPTSHSIYEPSSATEPAFALSQPSVRISILTLLDGSQISLCISRSDTPTPLPANGAAPDPQSGDYRKFLIPTATLLSSLQKTYDFVLSTRKPAPVQQNMSAPGAAPSYATMSGMTNPSRLRSSTASTSMSESAALPTPRVPDPPAPSAPQDAASQPAERARQDSLKRPLKEPAAEASSSVIRPTRYIKSRRSQPHTGGLEMAGHPKWTQPARDESSASGFRLQWPDYDNPESLVAEPVDRHRPPPSRGETASRSTTPWPQASASQRTVSGPQHNSHTTMPFLNDATGRPVSRASMTRGSEQPSDPATSPQQVAPSHTVDADVSSPEASASEVQEERAIRANLMAALREAGFDEMSQADREELLISTCLAQHRGAKRRLMALQRNNENANRETKMAREAERRANAAVQQLQLELQRKQEEDDTQRSALERSNADLQTELQQLRAHVQRINTHAMHGDYLRLGPESAENSQEAFGSDTTEEVTAQQQQQQQQLQLQPQPQQQQRYGAQQMLSPHDLAPRPLLAAAAESSLNEALRSLDSSARPTVQQRSLSLQTGRAMEALYGGAPPPNGGGLAGGAQQLALAEPLPQLAELAFQELMNASSRANEDMQLHHADSTSAHGEAHDAAAMQMRPPQQQQQQQQQLSAERASLDGAIVSLINGTSESHVRAEPNDMQT